MKIAIIGVGGHSKVIRDLISLKSNIEIVAYLDDKYEKLSKSDNTFRGPIGSAKTIGSMFNDIKFIIAIGNNKIRKRIANKLGLPNVYYETLIHPTAYVSPSAVIGNGSVIMAYSVVNSDSRIGDHSIINTGAIVEHDNQIGDFVHISPHATITGGVGIEEGVHVGAGATIIPNKTIGEWSVIGAGATVIHSIPFHCTAVGIPAVVKNKQLIEGVYDLYI
ncbi:acetyltransferase [Bacillus sp. FJAT-50079]|uniref:acetyltransferase n=1 Tax=Bacillus sp. FJAT-50079 TaxID=2833577 RepID=UPI001BC96292|nr:acetyltransferase [Bacillus sp. FJAT-50079]MBS4209156.1 acetyltransferase [Bacillus sp. FJAT-50079]